MLDKGVVLSGRYEIIEKLGSGGMAIAYLGKDLKLGRYVTVKVLREEFVSDEDFVERFRTEARSAARLSHQNIVNVYDVGEDNGVNFIVMEYIHGDTLKKAIQEKAPFDAKSILNVSIQLASALAHAHKNRIVHRDIKPQNILVGADGVIKITDFGIARAASGSTMEANANAMGSVHYFSPEQARGGYVDERSDIYSLGITMYEMVTARIPFDGDNSVAIAIQHLNDDFPDMRLYNPNVPRSLEGIIKKATMKRSDERYPSIELMLEDLNIARDENNSALKAAAAGENPHHSDDYQMPELYYGGADSQVSYERRMANEQTSGYARDDESDYADVYDNDSRKDVTGSMRISRGNDYDEGYEDMPRKSKRPDPYKKSPQRKTASGGKGPAGAKKRPQSTRPRKPRDYDDEYDDSPNKSSERKVIAAAVITAIVIILAISFAGYKMMGGGGLFGSRTADIPTPSFVGITLEAAQTQAKELGLKLSKEAEDYSDQMEGLIYFQDVEAGKLLRKGDEVLVRVSLGMAGGIMPNVIEMRENAASEAIYDVLETAQISVEYQQSEDVEAGRVIRQSPANGSKLDESTKVTLIVSRGSEEDGEVTVPYLEETSEADAVSALESLDLTTGSITRREHDTIKEGLVISQSVQSGTKVEKGTTVNLVISSGKPAEPEPDPEPEPETPPASNTDNGGQNAGNGANTNTGTNNNSGGDAGANGGAQPSVPEAPVETNPPATVTPGDSGTAATGSSTRNFPIYLNSDSYGDTVQVKVIRIGSDGQSTVVMDSQQSTASFPSSVAVTGSGSTEVQCYINNELIWSENVNFSE